MTLKMLVETDNFGGGYPDEKLLCIKNAKGEVRSFMASAVHAMHIQDALNGPDAEYGSRYWKLVDCSFDSGSVYVLQGGFEA